MNTDSGNAAGGTVPPLRTCGTLCASYKGANQHGGYCAHDLPFERSSYNWTFPGNGGPCHFFRRRPNSKENGG
jgi:hypothetical protein